MAHTIDPKNPRIALEEDHRHISSLLERLVVLLRADDRVGAIKALRTAEEVILAHLDGEEMFLLPALASAIPAEATRLRAEHAEIRRTLGELGLACELHTVRAEAVEAFCASLREHAEREEAILYAEAERRLPVLSARSLLARLRGAAASIVKPARAPRPRRRSTARVAS
jgi:hemerythrin-like domain-containing protein